MVIDRCSARTSPSTHTMSAWARPRRAAMLTSHDPGRPGRRRGDRGSQRPLVHEVPVARARDREVLDRRGAFEDLVAGPRVVGGHGSASAPVSIARRPANEPTTSAATRHAAHQRRAELAATAACAHRLGKPRRHRHRPSRPSGRGARAGRVRRRSCFLTSDQLAERLAASGDQRLHGGDRAPEHLRGVALGQVFVVAQHERGTLAGVATWPSARHRSWRAPTSGWDETGAAEAAPSRCSHARSSRRRRRPDVCRFTIARRK